MICITIDNGSNNTVGGSCYSACIAESRFMEDYIGIVSCALRKCRTLAGISGHSNKSYESITAAGSKLSG